MARGRHARPREPRSGGITLAVVGLVAAAAAAAAIVVEDVRVVRVSVVLLALVVALAIAMLLGRSHDTERALHQLLSRRDDELAQRHAETRQLRLELHQVSEVNAGLAAELARLRAQVEGLVVPLPREPEPVYPALHLPLVRAAFAEDLPPAVVYEPVRTPGEVPPAVQVDTGSDPVHGRRVLDLTAAEIRHLRKAAGT